MTTLEVFLQKHEEPVHPDEPSYLHSGTVSVDLNLNSRDKKDILSRDKSFFKTKMRRNLPIPSLDS